VRQNSFLFKDITVTTTFNQHGMLMPNSYTGEENLASIIQTDADE